MMQHLIIIIVLALAACGGGSPCDRPDWRDIPDCVPPVHLPCTYPCTDRPQGGE